MTSFKWRPEGKKKRRTGVSGEAGKTGQRRLKVAVSEVKSLSHVQLFETPWTVAHQAPPSMGFSRQEYWSGLPFPSAGDLLDSGIEPGSPTLQADALLSEPPGKPNLDNTGSLNKG